MSSRSRGHCVISPQLHFRRAIRPGGAGLPPHCKHPLSLVSHKKLSLVYGRFVQPQGFPILAPLPLGGNSNLDVNGNLVIYYSCLLIHLVPVTFSEN